MPFRRQANGISASDAAARHAGGQLQLVDVREPEEVAEVRIPDAVHIPLGELGDRMGELDRQRPVAFVCRSGNRSAMATRAAGKAGLDAVNVEGGVLAWAKAGLPLWPEQK